MPDKLSFSKTFQALEQAIRISQKRHAVISSNISNLDTPGYKPEEVDFKAALQQALTSEQGTELARTDPRHIALEMNASGGIAREDETSGWNGYNWVNIDKEMTRLTENNLIYRTSVEILLRKIAILKEVLK